MSFQSHLHPLAELLDCLEDVVAWVKDREGRYCWVNRAFLINFSIEASQYETGAVPQILGKTDYELSPPFLADQFRLDDEYVLAGHRVVNRIELVGQPDGLTVWNLTNKIPLLNEDGVVIGTAGLTRNLTSKCPGFGQKSEFGPVLAYIKDHFHSPVTNRQLARLAHMSVRAFERKFQANFHLTPQKYLRRLRLRMATRALVYTKGSMAAVAMSCGFSDQSHFTREFRRHFGRTPRDYREHYARGDAAAAPVTNSAADEQVSATPAPYIRST